MEKSYQLKVWRGFGGGVHARCKEIIIQEFGKKLERNGRPFSLHYKEKVNQ